MKHAGMEGVKHHGMAAEHGLRSLWISIPLWEAIVMFTLKNRKLFYIQHQQGVSPCNSKSVFLTYCPYLHYYPLIIFPYSCQNPFVSKSLRKKNNFLLNLGQGNTLAEEGAWHDASASLRHGSKTWPQFQVSQRKEEKLGKAVAVSFVSALREAGWESPLCQALLCPVPWEAVSLNRVTGIRRGGTVSTKGDCNGIYLSWFISPSSRAEFDFCFWRIFLIIPGEYFWEKENVQDRHKTHETLFCIVLTNSTTSE